MNTSGVRAWMARLAQRLWRSPVTEPESVKIVRLRRPTQCILWEQPNGISGKFSEIFDEIECYEDSSHLTRSLYKCKECGQLYFHEWYEWVDWEDGNDKMYTTLVPVQTTEEIEVAGVDRHLFADDILTTPTPRRNAKMDGQGLVSGCVLLNAGC